MLYIVPLIFGFVVCWVILLACGLVSLSADSIKPTPSPVKQSVNTTSKKNLKPYIIIGPNEIPIDKNEVKACERDKFKVVWK